MTPLQQAAQAVITRWDTSDWKSTRHTAEYITDLRKALEAEQAQAVEATTTKTEQVAGAISKHISTPLIQREVIAAAQYIAHRYMRPAPPPTMHLSEILAAKGITLQKTFVEKPRDRIADAGKTMGERAELIAGLREHATFMCIEGAEKQRTLKAADMLEADAREIEATERQVEILSDELSKCDKAQQVAVPTLRECHYESPTSRVCNKCGQRHDNAIFNAQGAKP